VRQANDGDDVVVENNGAPVARIVPYVEAPQRRKGGFAKG
jgi:prevent-host-death family protein